MVGMKSWQHEDSFLTVALNLCLGMAYSLFLNSLSFGGVQNPRYSIFVAGTVEKTIMCRAVNGWFESSARFFLFYNVNTHFILYYFFLI